MVGEGSVRLNADQLGRRVEAARVAAIAGEAAEGHAEALDEMAHYVQLLREAAADTAARYSFKRVLSDGSWDVEEQRLPTAPRVGDVVKFQDDGLWKVLRTQWVTPRPSGKPPRAFFVCAPAMNA